MSNFILKLVIIFLLRSPDKHAVNGAASKPPKYPFLASLRFSSLSHHCGCTIIAPSWALTAAHCIKSRLVHLMTVQYSTSKVTPLGRNVVGVARVIIHEDYDLPNMHINNIALIELARPLKFNKKTLKAVSLPKKNFELPKAKKGTDGVLVGWARNSTGNSLARNLQEVKAKLYSDDECKKKQNGSTTKDNICAGVSKIGKDSCFGDTGGPLLFKGSTLVGIASWIKRNSPCGEPSYPTVYTKVSHYIEWINKHMW